ncbi:hypothetical protein JW698_00415 [Candidatus Wolfebacteria bacterium]|nr:hypothetical protein [Candidatus Wolfebacteria bacterium]
MASPKFVLGLVILIAIFHILGTIYSWYWIIGYFDMLMHFSGGFWLASLFLFFFLPKITIIKYKTFIQAVLTVSFSAFVGVLWEFFEFGLSFFILGDNFSGFIQHGLPDTLSDLVFDILGGFACFCIYKIFNEKSLKSLNKTDF